MQLLKHLKSALNIKFDKAFGLDISDRSIEVVELSKFIRFAVVNSGRIELPEGLVNEGLILKKDELALELKTLLQQVKPKRLSTNKVILSVPEAQVFTKCLVIDAKIKNSDLEKYIYDKLVPALPVNLDKLYWDYLLKPLGDKTKKMVIFFGVPKGVADSYVKFVNSIGLEVVSLTVESLSLARTVLKRSDQQSLIVDIGASDTTLSFFDGSDKINLSITVDEANERNISKLVNEIKEAINYYEGVFSQQIDVIYLAGATADDPGVREGLEAGLERPVQLVLPSAIFNLKRLPEKEKNFTTFIKVIGLGMIGSTAGLEDINFLKKMPKSEVNDIKTSDLFKMGYLSRVDALRAVLNNGYILTLMILIIAGVFALLMRQVEMFGLASAIDSIN